jgi:hypothetical protein
MHVPAALISLAACLAHVTAQATGADKPRTSLPSRSVTAAASQATIPITVQSNTFKRGNERFFIKGVDYQPGGSSSTVDVLGDATICERDFAVMQQLGVNTVRVYSIDNSVNHDACMALMQKAGIYLVLDLNTPQNSLNRNDAAASYNAAYLQHLFATVDAFKGFDNVLGFFAGNEVVNDIPTTGTAPWIKAVIRDVKQYIAAQSKRLIYVGYSSTDVPESRYLLPEYLSCGDDPLARADFIGTNVYSWCGDSSYTKAGWDQLVAGFGDLVVPVFFSEYGCNLVAGNNGRPFTEVATLYGSQMTGVFSGGLVYEYSEEPNDYGLVEIDSSGGVSALPDFYNLQKQYASVKIDTSASGTSKTSAPSCPGNSTTFPGVWEAGILPVQPAGAADYFKNGAGKPLGNGGTSTQQAGNAAPVRQESASNSTASRNNSTRSGSGSATSATAAATSRSAAVLTISAVSPTFLTAWVAVLSAALGAAVFV